jgi:hypothetical protein
MVKTRSIKRCANGTRRNKKTGNCESITISKQREYLTTRDIGRLLMKYKIYSDKENGKPEPLYKRIFKKLEKLTVSKRSNNTWFTYGEVGNDYYANLLEFAESKLQLYKKYGDKI